MSFFLINRKLQAIWYPTSLMFIYCFYVLYFSHYILYTLGLLTSFQIYIQTQTPLASQNHVSNNLLGIFVYNMGSQYCIFDPNITTISTSQRIAYAKNIHRCDIGDIWASSEKVGRFDSYLGFQILLIIKKTQESQLGFQALSK